MIMAARKRTGTGTASPKGFKKVETTLGGFWKPELPGQSAQGVVGTPVEISGNDGANVFYTFKITDAEITGPIVDKNGKKVHPENGMVIGVGGKYLLMFLRDRIGKEVYLVYSGLGNKKPGQSPPKLFDTFERESED
jgi:hypothetical protein